MSCDADEGEANHDPIVTSNLAIATPLLDWLPTVSNTIGLFAKNGSSKSKRRRKSNSGRISLEDEILMRPNCFTVANSNMQTKIKSSLTLPRDAQTNKY